MISEKDYLAALEIVNQFKTEEDQRNKILAIHISNDLKKYFKEHELYGKTDMQNFKLEPYGSSFRLTFPGDWSEELDGNEAFLRELERLSNEYNRTIKVPYSYYWK
jgi:hypothetical protein